MTKCRTCLRRKHYGAAGPPSLDFRRREDASAFVGLRRDAMAGQVGAASKGWGPAFVESTTARQAKCRTCLRRKHYGAAGKVHDEVCDPPSSKALRRGRPAFVSLRRGKQSFRQSLRRSAEQGLGRQIPYAERGGLPLRYK
jgi:hypothetical protein